MSSIDEQEKNYPGLHGLDEETTHSKEPNSIQEKPLTPIKFFAIIVIILIALAICGGISGLLTANNSSCIIYSDTNYEAQISSDPYLINGIYRVGYDDSFSWVVEIRGKVFSVSDEKLVAKIDSGCKNPRLGFVNDDKQGFTPVIFFPPDYLVRNITLVWIHDQGEVIEIIEPAGNFFKKIKQSEIL